ncbi:DUF4873 domain-containing protein [Haloechinothrix sp. YIM 98757]|uniref:DUF4873 domain-containing protein n=1 Tax=Haloechinothrix aidingensis TaxID=2752311 RepID=A0A838A8N3_9PSEU|nr:DUF4873 domain-containing protein [Haloechinothrix aidingensis]MBA0124881.1 DUF4873 domain-containing protein [Haloechinothrix aidingensis]
MTAGTHPQVIIVGAGFAGLCTAIKLAEAGIEDFRILEKADELGGTWRENTYPGCGCDVPSLMYSYSFAPNPHWSRMYARQPEILDYLRRVVRRYDLGRYIEFGTEVTSYEFDEEADRWWVRTAGGRTYHPRIVVAAPGPLHEPKIPELPGRERFRGTSFHSAEWDHSYDTAGKRVAVIGTGASAVQFIPRLARDAQRMSVFQRTPHWVLPKWDRRLTRTERVAFRVVPGLRRLYRYAIYWIHEALILGFLHPRLMRRIEAIARGQLRRQVADPELRRDLTPDYTIGCKRILISSDYYPALQRENVELVTGGIAEITPDGIRTRDGSEREFDAIVYATGFAVTDRFAAERIVGKGGLTIQQAWRDGMEAFQGIAVAGFPNFFLMLGPNSGGGNQSIVFMIEAQAGYIVQCLRQMEQRDVTRIEVRPAVQRRFNQWVHGKLAGSVWNSGGCDSWYLDDTGANRAAWPGSSVSYWRRMRQVNPEHFEWTAAADREPEHAYHGPATLTAGTEELPVTVTLSGHLEPIDGAFHWYGRVAADDAVIAWKRANRRVTLSLPGREAVHARLVEVDPWGHVRISGTGVPPFPVESLEEIERTEVAGSPVAGS